MIKISDDDICHFDSYGTNIDDQLNFIPEQYRMQHNMMHRWLSELIINSPYKNIHYNPYKLQGPETQTCGRWCGHFMSHMMDPEIYKKYLKSIKKQSGIKNNDELIIYLTDRVLK